jgi:voltage-gated potassium channel
MDDRARRVAERLEAPMLVAAALTVPAIVIEEAGATGGWLTLAHTLDWITWAAFAFEMVAMLTVVRSRARWLRDHPLELAIVLLTPPFLPASLATLRVFRLLRLLRLLRLAQLARRVFSTEGLRDAGVILLVTILGGGAAFRAFEHQPLSLWDGVWFAIAIT